MASARRSPLPISTIKLGHYQTLRTRNKRPSRGFFLGQQGDLRPASRLRAARHRFCGREALNNQWASLREFVCLLQDVNDLRVGQMLFRDGECDRISSGIVLERP